MLAARPVRGDQPPGQLLHRDGEEVATQAEERTGRLPGQDRPGEGTWRGLERSVPANDDVEVGQDGHDDPDDQPGDDRV